MISSEPFVYSRISATHVVRLMVLRPSRLGARLQCELRDVEVSTLNNYEAISYTWGHDTTSSTILCGPDKGVIKIPRNLECALLHFRQSDAFRLLWADSICIDQSNLQERSDQVRIMGIIFSQADRVLVWIGSEDQDTVAAFEYFRLVEKLVYENRRKPPISSFQNTEEISKYFGIPSTTSPQYLSFYKSFSRAWFQRAWVFQEAILAREVIVYWGRFHTTGRQIVRICRCLQYLDLQFDYGPIHTTGWTGHIASLFYSKETMMSDPVLTDTLRLLAKRRGLGVTDPRDLVYSLLGVASNAHGIQPDYTRTTNEVFIEVSRELIKSRGDLKLLGRVLNPVTDLPTWVADWRSGRSEDWAFSFLTTDLYSAAGTSEVAIKNLGRDELLRLEGIRVDTIKLQNMDPGLEQWKLKLPRSTSTLELFDSWGNTYKHTTEPMNIALFRTYNVDKEWVNGYGWERLRRGPIDDPELLTGRSTSQLSEQRQFFVTKGNRIGLAPLHARIGDLVCILLGGEVPLLLREDEQVLTFVGECYVHGLMDGEGLIQARKLAQPEWDTNEDPSWLERLHIEPIPFDTEEFLIH